MITTTNKTDAPWRTEPRHCNEFNFGFKPPSRLVWYPNLQEDDDNNNSEKNGEEKEEDKVDGDDSDEDQDESTGDKETGEKKKKKERGTLREIEEDDDFNWPLDIEEVYFSRDEEEKTAT